VGRHQDQSKASYCPRSTRNLENKRL